eukprot:Nk52_evm28s2506 gene=Nk52_evmTU28s2506
MPDSCSETRPRNWSAASSTASSSCLGEHMSVGGTGEQQAGMNGSGGSNSVLTGLVRNASCHFSKPERNYCNLEPVQGFLLLSLNRSLFAQTGSTLNRVEVFPVEKHFEQRTFTDYSLSNKVMRRERAFEREMIVLEREQLEEYVRIAEEGSDNSMASSCSSSPSTSRCSSRRHSCQCGDEIAAVDGNDGDTEQQMGNSNKDNDSKGSASSRGVSAHKKQQGDTIVLKIPFSHLIGEYDYGSHLFGPKGFGEMNRVFMTTSTRFYIRTCIYINTPVSTAGEDAITSETSSVDPDTSNSSLYLLATQTASSEQLPRSPKQEVLKFAKDSEFLRTLCSSDRRFWETVSVDDEAFGAGGSPKAQATELLREEYIQMGLALEKYVYNRGEKVQLRVRVNESCAKTEHYLLRKVVTQCKQRVVLRFRDERNQGKWVERKFTKVLGSKKFVMAGPGSTSSSSRRRTRAPSRGALITSTIPNTSSIGTTTTPSTSKSKATFTSRSRIQEHFDNTDVLNLGVSFSLRMEDMARCNFRSAPSSVSSSHHTNSSSSSNSAPRAGLSASRNMGSSRSHQWAENGFKKGMGPLTNNLLGQLCCSGACIEDDSTLCVSIGCDYVIEAEYYFTTGHFGKLVKRTLQVPFVVQCAPCKVHGDGSPYLPPTPTSDQQQDVMASSQEDLYNSRSTMNSSSASTEILIAPSSPSSSTVESTCNSCVKRGRAESINSIASGVIFDDNISIDGSFCGFCEDIPKRERRCSDDQSMGSVESTEAEGEQKPDKKGGELEVSREFVAETERESQEQRHIGEQTETTLKQEEPSCEEAKTERKEIGLHVELCANYDEQDHLCGFEECCTPRQTPPSGCDDDVKESTDSLMELASRLSIRSTASCGPLCGGGEVDAVRMEGKENMGENAEDYVHQTSGVNRTLHARNSIPRRKVSIVNLKGQKLKSLSLSSNS